MAWIMVVGVARMAACLAMLAPRQRKTEDRAGLGLAGGDLDEVAAGGGEQGLLAGGFGPVARVGGERLRLAAVELAIDAADEADAVGAGAAAARLMVVGRAEPGAGEEDDVGAGHG